ncbi:Ig-like domain-containing protein [Candidatus Enterococcus ikei]|uniref:Bacterial Ig domain-containing protein n=1 Tax=Candidatus Enterococcus ikei TaxID=2815326 RepID=A0ABS3GZG7_9ENTE|nr:Ig-like domain-containing protein [Enterococcus sp. DIV0869a]MBO0440240.1 hypothetical protein [Enterococcus sp. DIV0869a]
MGIKKKEKLILLLLLLVFLGALFYQKILKNSNEIKASGDMKTTATNLLKQENWNGYYNYGGKTVAMGKLKPEDNIKVKDDGYGKLIVSYSNVSLTKSQREKQTIFVEQTFQTTPNNYYVFKTRVSGGDMSAAGIEAGIKIDNNEKPLGLFVMEGKPKVVNLFFKAKSTQSKLSLYNYGDVTPYKLSLGNISFTTPSVYDATEELNEFTALINDLFTDETQTAIKLKVTQTSIDELRIKFNEVKEVFTTTESDTFDNNLKKAQTLLDAVNINLTPEKLVTDHEDPHSNTIIGKTFPNAFLNFSGSTLIPAAQIDSPVNGDTGKYHIQADNQGNFRYALPTGSYFTYGEKITILSTIHGKVISKTVSVLDETPPEQPSLNDLKDASTIFSGNAEKNSTVKVYDNETNSLFLEGKANADDTYSLSIPTTKQPLVPYKNYYVIATDAAGNSSKKSLVQTVADTTPPKAEPVNQVIQLGDPLPDISKMYKGLYDNAGADSVEVVLTKQPDITKVGVAQGELTLTDTAKNTTIIKVLFFVKDSQTIMNDNYMFHVADFSALAIDFPEKVEERPKFLLKYAKAELWDVKTGENKTDQIMINQGTIDKKPGIYDIIFSFGTFKKTVTATLLEGTIGFSHVDSNISFGEQTINSKKQFVSTQDSLNLIIEDTRYVMGNWRIVTKLSQPLQTNQGNQTASTLVLQTTDAAGNQIRKRLSDKKTTEFYYNKNAVNGQLSFMLGKSEQQQILLNVLPGTVLANKEYSSSIMWIIENAP